MTWMANITLNGLKPERKIVSKHHYHRAYADIRHTTGKYSSLEEDTRWHGSIFFLPSLYANEGDDENAKQDE